MIKLEDAVPLSEKEIESQVSKKEDDDNNDKPSEETQDSKQVTWSLNLLLLIAGIKQETMILNLDLTNQVHTLLNHLWVSVFLLITLALTINILVFKEQQSNVEELEAKEGSEENAKNEDMDNPNESVETENKNFEEEKVELNMNSESKQDANNNVEE